jgi:serine/threonine protein kinase
MSTLQSVYLESVQDTAFWKEYSPLSCRKVMKSQEFKGYLKFKYQDYGSLYKEVKVTSSSLYFDLDDGTIIIGKINWCVLESFYEESSDSTLYGFSINTGLEKLDFYTGSIQELNLWLQHLSHISILNRYEEDYVIIKKLNKSQMNTIYLCQDIVTKQEFALKKIKKNTLTDCKALHQVYNEICILKKVDHPNVIKLYKVYENQKNICLIMEYTPYGNLCQRLKARNLFTEKDVIYMCRTLLETFSYLHSKGIVHRNLKLESILMMCCNASDFKITDFGHACFVDKMYNSRSGSPGYIAPEILRGNCYSSKVDIFSVGVIVYILLTGMQPFYAHNLSQVLEKNIKCSVKFNIKELKDLSVHAVDLLKDLLNSEPYLRPTADIALKSLWLKFRTYNDSEPTSISLKLDSTKGENFSKVSERLIVNRK